MIPQILTTLSATLFGGLLATVDLNPPDIQSLIQSGLKFGYVEEFDSAAVYFGKITEQYPENPAGYFYNAALLQLRMMDGCHFNNEKDYLDLLKTASKKAEQILKQEDNPWAEYYLGSVYAYRAVFEGLKGNYFETFNYGVKGGKILLNIIKKDSTFYDAYLGSGTYEYFWARAGRYLPILKLVGGDANEAMRKLYVAAEKSFYSGPTARNSLVFIYGEEKKYELATAMIDSLISDFPNSKTFTWNKAELEFKKRNYPLAIELFHELFGKYEKDDNYSNLAQCMLYIGKCHYALKEKDAARQAFKDVISYKNHVDQCPKIEGYCREAYGLLSKLL